MLRFCFATVLLSIAVSAAAQNTPPSANPTSQQPGLPQSPGLPTGNSDPTAPTAAAPPTFVPGIDSEAAKPRGPIRISGGVMAGLLLTRVNPVYPPDARAAGMEGTVVLAALISKAGTVQDLKVISGPAAMADAATAAVKQWTYRPYLLNGRAVEVKTVITVNFQLSPPAQSSVPAGPAGT